VKGRETWRRLVSWGTCIVRKGGRKKKRQLPVITGEKEGNTERAQAPVLRISLLVVADRPDELLHRHGFLVLIEIPLGREACCGKDGGKEKRKSQMAPGQLHEAFMMKR
jgi:hypothetical protein